MMDQTNPKTRKKIKKPQNY